MQPCVGKRIFCRGVSESSPNLMALCTDEKNNTDCCENSNLQGNPTRKKYYFSQLLNSDFDLLLGKLDILVYLIRIFISNNKASNEILSSNY